MKNYIYELNYKDIGIKDRRIKVTAKDVQKMKQLRNEGLSYEKIARALNMNYANVYLHLNPSYYEKYKKCMVKHNKKYYMKNKDRILKNHKKYEDRKREILKSIDTSKYLTKKSNNKIKTIIMNYIEPNKEYTYRQIRDLLNKDYCIFSNRLKELKNDGLIDIIEYKNYKCIKKVI